MNPKSMGSILHLLMKVSAGLLGILIVAVIAVLILNRTVGYRIAAAPMNELRSSIEVGMSRSKVKTLMTQYDHDHMSDTGTSGGFIQTSQSGRNFLSPVNGGWNCYLTVYFADDKVESVDDVSCFD